MCSLCCRRLQQRQTPKNCHSVYTQIIFLDVLTPCLADVSKKHVATNANRNIPSASRSKSVVHTSKATFDQLSTIQQSFEAFHNALTRIIPTQSPTATTSRPNPLALIRQTKLSDISSTDKHQSQSISFSSRTMMCLLILARYPYDVLLHLLLLPSRQLYKSKATWTRRKKIVRL